MHWFAIAIGGALGAMSRFAVTAYVFPLTDNRFPLGTLLVNVVGSALIGIAYVLIIERGLIAPEWRHIAMTGFLGAFTTFSTFALDALTLWQNGHGMLAVSYILASVISSLLAVSVAISLTLRVV